MKAGKQKRKLPASIFSPVKLSKAKEARWSKIVEASPVWQAYLASQNPKSKDEAGS